ncbi:MAG TPA: sulfatase-like hydrolase/transferase [Polyangiales bacterium]|nr:sulfatase-like hydrolase/transferase [Polyangiales bacterium]
MLLSQVARLRTQRFVRALFSKALPFWVCGSTAWFCLLAQDIAAEHADYMLVLGRALYLGGLACQYSTLFLGPLIVLHALRSFWLRWSSRPDAWLSLLVAAALAYPSFKRAYLLSSGSSLLFEPAARLRSLILVTLSLLSACLAVWHVHLALVGAPRHKLSELLDRCAPRRRTPLYLLIAGLGAVALFQFSELVSRELRAYLFLSEFLLPLAFLFAASLLYALQRRAAGWLSLVFGLAIAAALITAQTQQTGLHRAKAFFERRAGLIALTDLATGYQRGAPYANLDVSQPEQFHCPEPKPQPESEAPKSHRNVILISVDTLRKDALQTRDKTGPIAPELQRIASKSLSFERAVTTYPATLFAIGSALTGESPSEIMFAPQAPANLFTRTASRFQDFNIMLPLASWFRRSPIPELFTQVVQPRFFADAETATTNVLYRLRDARTRKHSTFTWIHYYEPHTTRITRSGDTVALARQSYAELVREVDHQIGRLWSELERLDYLKDSLIIIFSDHGEALGEFGYFGHHVYLNQFATDVPLIVHAPDVAPGNVQQLALLSDIAPTVLTWLGLPNDAHEARDLLSLRDDHAERFGVSEAFPVRGRALYEVARSPIHTPTELSERIEQLRTAAIDYQPKVSLVSDRYRLIVNRVTGGEEFYDRVEDPTEKNDLAPQQLKIHKRMRKALRTIMQKRSERIYCRVQNAGLAARGPVPKAPEEARKGEPAGL